MYAATTAGSIADATRASDGPESGVNSAGKKKPYAVRKSDHLRRSLRGLATPSRSTAMARSARSCSVASTAASSGS